MQRTVNRLESISSYLERRRKGPIYPVVVAGNKHSSNRHAHSSLVDCGFGASNDCWNHAILCRTPVGGN